MKLVKPTYDHLMEVMLWFADDGHKPEANNSLNKYTPTSNTFLQDVNLKELQSYALVDELENIIAFGQVYLRLGHCHLARIVVEPANRGRGFGKKLISSLIKQACIDLKVNAFSLFVHSDNVKGINTYKNLGFVLALYPEKLEMQDCLYMLTSNSGGSKNA